MAVSEVVVCRFAGSRYQLRPLFAQADDSSLEIDSYLALGEVFVARRAARIVGHVQLLAGGADWEIKSLAVIDTERGRGIGAALARTAVRRAFDGGGVRVRVATAAADIANLRFYQRLGFRMERIERDAFTVDRGYSNLEVDGIPIRDRVWFSIEKPCSSHATG
jgi:ribosomal protein S18 acetylase RimI-like enzyme